MGHYAQWQRGETVRPLLVRYPQSGTCRFDGCSQPVRTRGLCQRHYKQELRGADLTELPPKVARVKDRECAYPDCTRVAHARDLCLKHYGRAWAFNLTAETFIRLTYQTSCNACGDAGGELHIDHDHSCCPGPRSCGQCIRGVLCMSCNTALGHVKDDAGRLEALANYLATSDPEIGGASWGSLYK
ncbi:endonuclease domain-containing protein [Nonomuraea zeae]|uniref:endonuclease domain-containing protein n=1 Tax=Nonomuraea zeae TaxID=1642303 RepID=UPI00362257AF